MSKKLYICPKCGDVKTEEEVMFDAGHGGMGMCDCDFTNRIYYDYKEIEMPLIIEGVITVFKFDNHPMYYDIYTGNGLEKFLRKNLPILKDKKVRITIELLDEE